MDRGRAKAEPRWFGPGAGPGLGPDMVFWALGVGKWLLLGCKVYFRGEVEQRKDGEYGGPRVIYTDLSQYPRPDVYDKACFPCHLHGAVSGVAHCGGALGPDLAVLSGCDRSAAIHFQPRFGVPHSWRSSVEGDYMLFRNTISFA